MRTCSGVRWTCRAEMFTTSGFGLSFSPFVLNRLVSASRTIRSTSVLANIAVNLLILNHRQLGASPFDDLPPLVGDPRIDDDPVDDIEWTKVGQSRMSELRAV